ncbi:hypothetical protein COOONC_15532 [Cooperia oncophora]
MGEPRSSVRGDDEYERCKLNELYDIFTNVVPISSDVETHSRDASVANSSQYEVECILDTNGETLHKENYTCVNGQWKPRFVRLPFCRHSEFYMPVYIPFDYY